MPAADAARAVIGPDHPAAAWIAVVGIIAAGIIAPVEVAIAVMGAMMAPVSVIAAISKATMAIAADMAVKGRRGAEATDMAAVKSTAAEAADMPSAKTTAMEAAPAKTSAVKAAAMSMPAAVANLRDEVVCRSLGRGRRRRIDQGECFSAAR